MYIKFVVLISTDYFSVPDIEKNTYFCFISECEIDYKINDNIPEFLNVRGVLEDKELEKYRREQDEAKSKTTTESMPQKYKNRRLSEIGTENECCCSPRTLILPTFISNSRYNEVLDRLKHDNDNFTRKEH